MSKSASSPFVLLGLFALAGCASAARAPSGDDGERFARFKALAGDWVAKDDGSPHGGAKVNYRVTAGESAVVETHFQGSDHEMVTVYTLDRGNLVLTHYCALGNQPHMLVEPSSPAGPIEFDLDSLGNGDPASHMHMHHAKIDFVDANHVTEHWTLWKDGKAAQTVDISLARAN